MSQNAFVTLIGNMVRDPELAERNGTKVCSFTLAVNTSTKKPDGTYDSNFYDCSLWGKDAEWLQSKAQKGTGCVVVGEVASVEYQGQDGKMRTRLRCRAYAVRCTARTKDGAAGAAPQAQAPGNFVAQQDPDLPF